MPHSSGGGSHGGGSHGGSHGGSRGGGSSRRVGSSDFAGATRYVYYRNHRPVYVYANYDITRKPSKARYLLLLVYLPFFILLSAGLKNAIHNPKPLSMDYDTQIVIADTLNVLGSASELESAMKQFQDVTGITPAVITVATEDWVGNYDSLETYAYELYVDAFPDEKHWLIVYSQPRGAEFSDASFTDWAWEGMQGNDTDPIITERIADSFRRYLQGALLAKSQNTISSAIAASFGTFANSKDSHYIMKKYVEWNALGGCIFVFAFLGIHMFFMVFYNPNSKEYLEAKPCPTYAQEDTCEYCGGVYVVGTATSCPHCSAPVKAHTYYQNPAGNPAMNGYTAAPYQGAPGYGVPNAQNPYGQNPYAQNPYGQNLNGQNPYAQNPYGQNPNGQNPYDQNPYQDISGGNGFG